MKSFRGCGWENPAHGSRDDARNVKVLADVSEAERHAMIEHDLYVG